MSKTTTKANVINLDLGAKEFLINNNPDKKVYLNPNDMSIVSRIQDAIPQLNDLETRYVKLYTDAETKADTETDEEAQMEQTIITFAKSIKDIDAEMRELVNYIFDYDVCSVIKPTGTLLDLFDGEYAFAIIINTLLELYSDTITEETNKLVGKMKKRAEKYTAQDHKRKGKK